MRNSAAQLQRLAQERADDQARRIPWQRLLEVRNQYIDWLRHTRPSLPKSRSLLVGMRKEVAESQTCPLSLL